MLIKIYLKGLKFFDKKNPLHFLQERLSAIVNKSFCVKNSKILIDYI
jgi:hypothetical protein